MDGCMEYTYHVTKRILLLFFDLALSIKPQNLSTSFCASWKSIRVNLGFIAGETPLVTWYREFVSVLHHCHIIHCRLSQTPKTTESLSLSLIHQKVLFLREKGTSQSIVSAPNSFAVPLP